MLELNQRSREILSHIVEAYVATGEPVGSKTLSHRLGMSLSSATIRNVMADLERLGLLYAPHTSAGRLPTEKGLQLFVNGLLEIGELSPDEAFNIEQQCRHHGQNYNSMMEKVTLTLSGLSHCAGLVLAPKQDAAVKHIEFVQLRAEQALVVLVLADGSVENRVIEIPAGLPTSALTEASNYLNAHLVGRTLAEARDNLERELKSRQAQLNEVASRLVERGLAVWSGDTSDSKLIIRGQAHLLHDVQAVDDIERIRNLFDMLESKTTFISVVEAVQSAEGVQIFIGAENALFRQAGCSLIIAPFRNSQSQVIGSIGVVGPARLNYGKIIPMVDFTAKLLTHYFK